MLNNIVNFVVGISAIILVLLIVLSCGFLVFDMSQGHNFGPYSCELLQPEKEEQYAVLVVVGKNCMNCHDYDIRNWVYEERTTFKK